MSEGEIRQAAKMYALVAEMEAVKASIEGMKADNKQREIVGASMAWPGDCFVDAQLQLEAIATRFRDEI